MRALATPFRAGLATVAVVLLSACGSDDEQPDAASTTSSPTSSASAEATTSDEEVQAFCTEAEAVLTAPEAAELTQEELLDQTIAQLEELDAPAEISADWDVLIDTFVGIRDTLGDIDLTTPEGQASAEQALAEIEAQATESQTRLDAWITENCDNA
ncbi:MULTISPECIES: hypothetical protein [unclassified Modestobacter]|uniref:hypothetical protein n=1 Tax=unclassified Modestobacter TaxID=2643866 RepID=UPI0022AAABA1|nr:MULTISPECIES: hypothetical protein [unclassified Modestobacter]MCZ2823436.1 hypothetical protein [Modestobacter sp. VKM Ac-2981]MCZ2851681.1 hypothetical protein [Modestobacter sp. VKM Ac-2982]